LPDAAGSGGNRPHLGRAAQYVGKQVFPGLERGAQISALNGAVPSQTATGQLR